MATTRVAAASCSSDGRSPESATISGQCAAAGAEPVADGREALGATAGQAERTPAGAAAARYPATRRPTKPVAPNTTTSRERSCAGKVTGRP